MDLGLTAIEVGMDPYAYVGENPESRTDPTGNKSCYNPSSDSVMVGCNSNPPSQQSENGSSGNGGGSKTKPPTNGNGTSCGTLTASECSQAQTKLKQRTADLTNWKGIIALIASFVPLVFDAIPFVKDIIALAKSFTLKKLFETIGDGIPVFLDLSAVLSKLVTLTGWKNIAWLADGVSAVANALSSAYKVIKGFLENRWLSTLADAGGWILEGLTTLFTGGGVEALFTGLSAAADGIWDS